MKDQSECKIKMTNYVSWIKVKGIDLLPPVITEKRRIELQRYRQQAIKLEKRLKNCRELKRNLEELLNLQPLTDRPHSEITHKDDTHIEALGITEKDKITHIPSKSKIRKVKLSKDIIDVTQYDNDGIKIIYNDWDANYAQLSQGYQLNSNESNEKCEADTSLSTSQIRTIFEPTNDYLDEDHSKTYLCQSENLSESNESNEIDNISLKRMKNHSTLSDTTKNTCPDKSPRPRLIRSNSYTLESPSPILLAHLQKNNKVDKGEGLEQSKDLSFTRNWSSLENNYVPFENSEYSSINTVYNLDEDNSSNKKNLTLNFPEPNKRNNINLEKSSPTIEVIQTDISVQQITVNTSEKTNEVDNLDEDNKFKYICDISDPNSQLMKALQSIPENYSEQIIGLIQKRKLDQQKNVGMKQFSPNTPKKNVSDHGLKNRNNKNPNLITDNISGNTHETIYLSSPRTDVSNSNTNLQSENQQGSLCQNAHLSTSNKLPDSSISESPSQSFYYSVSSSDTFRPSSGSSLQLFDLDLVDSKTDNGKLNSSEISRNEFCIEEEMRKMNVSRELFPEIDLATMNTLKQEWAASVICAHVKGYLTRRLLKTERVQTLIDTIKDALMCALQLHSAENIDESDVELHRRLINQVSAACYAFHDIFFSLSVQEQMSVISTDRVRKIEKAKRPASASSARRSRSSSSHSSSKKNIQLHSQSLTKV